jgi:hypothetical protein
MAMLFSRTSPSEIWSHEGLQVFAMTTMLRLVLVMEFVGSVEKVLAVCRLLMLIRDMGCSSSLP